MGIGCEQFRDIGEHSAARAEHRNQERGVHVDLGQRTWAYVRYRGVGVRFRVERKHNAAQAEQMERYRQNNSIGDAACCHGNARP